MKISSLIKIGISATALLLLPRRSSPRTDKILTPHPINRHSHLGEDNKRDNHSKFSGEHKSNDNK